MTDNKEGLGGLNIPKDEAFSEGSDLFENPPVQLDYIGGSTQIFYPITGVESDGPFEFNITSDGKHYLALPQTRLYGIIQILHKDGTTPGENEPVGVVNLFPSSLFKHIEIEVNGKKVSDATSSCYGIKSIIETQLSYGESAKKSHLKAARYYDDDDGKGNIRDSTNKGWEIRHELVKQGKKVDFDTILHCDFFQIYRYLPNGCSIRLKLVRNDDSFTLLNGDVTGNNATTKEYKINILDLRISVRKVLLHKRLFNINESLFLKGYQAVFPIVRTQIKTLVITKGLSSIIEANVIMGQLPRSVILCFVSNKAFNGNAKLNPYYFDHFNLKSASLRVAGERVPDSGYHMDFDNNLFVTPYRALFDSTGYSHGNGGNVISMKAFSQGNTFLAFDLTPDLCNGWHLHEERNGTIDIELSFKEELDESINLIVYSTYDNQLLMDKDRNVSFGFPI
jgi:hypothetical protein